MEYGVEEEYFFFPPSSILKCLVLQSTAYRTLYK